MWDRSRFPHPFSFSKSYGREHKTFSRVRSYDPSIELVKSISVYAERQRQICPLTEIRYTPQNTPVYRSVYNSVNKFVYSSINRGSLVFFVSPTKPTIKDMDLLHFGWILHANPPLLTYNILILICLWKTTPSYDAIPVFTFI